MVTYNEGRVGMNDHKQSSISTTTTKGGTTSPRPTISATKCTSPKVVVKPSRLRSPTIYTTSTKNLDLHLVGGGDHVVPRRTPPSPSRHRTSSPLPPGSFSTSSSTLVPPRTPKPKLRAVTPRRACVTSPAVQKALKTVALARQMREDFAKIAKEHEDITTAMKDRGRRSGSSLQERERAVLEVEKKKKCSGTSSPPKKEADHSTFAVVKVVNESARTNCGAGRTRTTTTTAANRRGRGVLPSTTAKSSTTPRTNRKSRTAASLLQQQGCEASISISQRARKRDTTASQDNATATSSTAQPPNGNGATPTTTTPLSSQRSTIAGRGRSSVSIVRRQLTAMKDRDLRIKFRKLSVTPTGSRAASKEISGREAASKEIAEDSTSVLGGDVPGRKASKELQPEPSSTSTGDDSGRPAPREDQPEVKMVDVDVPWNKNRFAHILTGYKNTSSAAATTIKTEKQGEEDHTRPPAVEEHDQKDTVIMNDNEPSSRITTTEGASKNVGKAVAGESSKTIDATRKRKRCLVAKDEFAAPLSGDEGAILVRETPSRAGNESGINSIPKDKQASSNANAHAVGTKTSSTSSGANKTNYNSPSVRSTSTTKKPAATRPSGSAFGRSAKPHPRRLGSARANCISEAGQEIDSDSPISTSAQTRISTTTNENHVVNISCTKKGGRRGTRSSWRSPAPSSPLQARGRSPTQVRGRGGEACILPRRIKRPASPETSTRTTPRTSNIEDESGARFFCMPPRTTTTAVVGTRTSRGVHLFSTDYPDAESSTAEQVEDHRQEDHRQKEMSMNVDESGNTETSPAPSLAAKPSPKPEGETTAVVVDVEEDEQLAPATSSRTADDGAKVPTADDEAKLPQEESNSKISVQDKEKNSGSASPELDAAPPAPEENPIPNSDADKPRASSPSSSSSSTSTSKFKKKKTRSSSSSRKTIKESHPVVDRALLKTDNDESISVSIPPKRKLSAEEPTGRVSSIALRTQDADSESALISNLRELADAVTLNQRDLLETAHADRIVFTADDVRRLLPLCRSADESAEILQGLCDWASRVDKGLEELQSHTTSPPGGPRTRAVPFLLVAFLPIARLRDTLTSQRRQLLPCVFPVTAATNKAEGNSDQRGDETEEGNKHLTTSSLTLFAIRESLLNLAARIATTEAAAIAAYNTISNAKVDADDRAAVRMAALVCAQSFAPPLEDVFRSPAGITSLEQPNKDGSTNSSAWASWNASLSRAVSASPTPSRGSSPQAPGVVGGSFSKTLSPPREISPLASRSPPPAQQQSSPDLLGARGGLGVGVGRQPSCTRLSTNLDYLVSPHDVLPPAVDLRRFCVSNHVVADPRPRWASTSTTLDPPTGVALQNPSRPGVLTPAAPILKLPMKQNFTIFKASDFMMPLGIGGASSTATGSTGTANKNEEEEPPPSSIAGLQVQQQKKQDQDLLVVQQQQAAVLRKRITGLRANPFGKRRTKSPVRSPATSPKIRSPGGRIVEEVPEEHSLHVHRGHALKVHRASVLSLDTRMDASEMERAVSIGGHQQQQQSGVSGASAPTANAKTTKTSQGGHSTPPFPPSDTEGATSSRGLLGKVRSSVGKEEKLHQLKMQRLQEYMKAPTLMSLDFGLPAAQLPAEAPALWDALRVKSVAEK
ncbi:unnamed protein product [Amoebophrya sp. A25]|nr:unnamed protein product [Amoebophrya sp. A25]|eukprot:GSA25T00002935001.1